MASTSDSGNGHGSRGSKQKCFDELKYESENSNEQEENIPPKFVPSPKHEHGSGKISENPIKSQEEGQKLLDTGYKDGKQIYNVTDDGTIVKFQPDNTPENGYHSYEVHSNEDISAKVLKALFKDGKISKNRYNKLIKGKDKRKKK